MDFFHRQGLYSSTPVLFPWVRDVLRLVVVWPGIVFADIEIVSPRLRSSLSTLEKSLRRDSGDSIWNPIAGILPRLNVEKSRRKHTDAIKRHKHPEAPFSNHINDQIESNHFEDLWSILILYWWYWAYECLWSSRPWPDVLVLTGEIPWRLPRDSKPGLGGS